MFETWNPRRWRVEVPPCEDWLQVELEEEEMPSDEAPLRRFFGQFDMQTMRGWQNPGQHLRVAQGLVRRALTGEERSVEVGVKHLLGLVVLQFSHVWLGPEEHLLGAEVSWQLMVPSQQRSDLLWSRMVVSGRRESKKWFDRYREATKEVRALQTTLKQAEKEGKDHPSEEEERAKQERPSRRSRKHKKSKDKDKQRDRSKQKRKLKERKRDEADKVEDSEYFHFEEVSAQKSDPGDLDYKPRVGELPTRVYATRGRKHQYSKNLGENRLLGFNVDQGVKQTKKYEPSSSASSSANKKARTDIDSDGDDTLVLS